LREIAFEEILKGKTVLGIGPGLGTHSETQKFIRTVVRETPLPTILDADGLNAFAGSGDLFRAANRVFSLLRLILVKWAGFSESQPRPFRQTVSQWRSMRRVAGTRTLSSRAYHSIVASPDGQTFISTSGNAGLAKGGTGDVLTGILAALIAQFGADDGARVLSLGVYLHGLAAELASRGTDLSASSPAKVADAVPAPALKLLEELRSSV